MSVLRKCRLLGLASSSFYYTPAGTPAEDIIVMNSIDKLYTNFPYYGSRRMVAALKKDGHEVGRKRVQRLMGEMGIRAVFPGPNTSKRNHQHKIYPYLLRGVTIGEIDQVWSTDITYIKMSKGFLYLVAIMDWFSRHVLSWRLGNCLGTSFCIEALEEAFLSGRVPEIFNTDQGTQFTSDNYVAKVLSSGCKLSMDGRGRALDNVFIERLWRSLKYEEVYIKDYRTVKEARTGISAYIKHYNHTRPHQSLDYRFPAEVYL